MGGEIPDEFFHLTTLREFEIPRDNFVGRLESMSDQLLNFTLLEDLDLAHNDFTGPIPNIFLQFKDLEELKLQGNPLTGEIPVEVCLERGTGNGQIGVLTVGCDIKCSCCDPNPDRN